ncbi:hypothetical protein ACO0SA_000531 [Hanseniaspora valbyensis]
MESNKGSCNTNDSSTDRNTKKISSIGFTKTLNTKRKRDTFRNFFKWHNKQLEDSFLDNITYDQSNNNTREEYLVNGDFKKENNKKLDKKQVFQEITNKQDYFSKNLFRNNNKKNNHGLNKDGSFRISLRDRLKMFTNKPNQLDKDEINLNSTGISVSTDKNLECYNQFKSSANNSNISFHKKDLYNVNSNNNDLDNLYFFSNIKNNYSHDLDEYKIFKNYEDTNFFKRTNSFYKKKNNLDLVGEHPLLKMTPFSPLVDKEPPMIKTLQTLEFNDDYEDDDNEDDENLRILSNSEINYANLVSPLCVQEEEQMEEEKEEASVKPVKIENEEDKKPNLELKNNESPIKIKDQENKIKEIGSGETLKNSLEEDINDENENVKCLVVPTFREKQWLTLNDYIKGHMKGNFSQLDIIDQAKGDKAQQDKILSNSKLIFDSSDFRNPSFFNESAGDENNNDEDQKQYFDNNADETSQFYSCRDDDTDIQTIKNSIRSVGFKTNNDSSKLKFNLVSEVFYYDQAEESKASNKLSLIESSKNDSTCTKTGYSSIEENQMFEPDSSNNPYNTPPSSITTESDLMLVDLSKMTNFGESIAQENFERLNDQLCIKNNETAWSFKEIKKLFENDDRISSGDQNNVNVQYRNQLTAELELDGCLADIESMGSPELFMPAVETVSPNGFFMKNTTETETLKEPKTNDAKNETAKIKSILKKKHNKNEPIERETSEIESSEKFDTFLSKFEDKEDLRSRMEPKLSQVRASQLRKFYSKEFYPKMHEDEEFLKSVRATQDKIGFSIYNEEPLAS